MRAHGSIVLGIKSFAAQKKLFPKRCSSAGPHGAAWQGCAAAKVVCLEGWSMTPLVER